MVKKPQPSMYGSMDCITIAGDSYTRPIADLVCQLTRCKRDSSYPDTLLSSEVDCSVVLILLLVLMAESYLARVRHFDKTANADTKRNVVKYLESLKGCKRMAKKFGEVYLLRNSIVHNHVFKYEHTWDSNGKHQNRKFEIDASWQGEPSKTVYSKYVALKKHAEPRTKQLGLRVCSTRMGREEVLKVFETVYQVLGRLREKGYLDISIGDLYVPYQAIGQNRKAPSFPFWSLIEEIRLAIESPGLKSS